jgi:hypothetical protein
VELRLHLPCIDRAARPREPARGADGRESPAPLPSIRPVHLRRALLLFAIVLGLAAIAASVSRPRDERSDQPIPAPGFPPPTETERTPTVSPGNADPGGPLAQVTFAGRGRKATRHVAAGQATTVLVQVGEPGQVEIPDLGLSATGDQLTPARFEIYRSESGAHEVVFTPAAGDESRHVGTLAIEPDGG